MLRIDGTTSINNNGHFSVVLLSLFCCTSSHKKHVFNTIGMLQLSALPLSPHIFTDTHFEPQRISEYAPNAGTGTVI